MSDKPSVVLVHGGFVDGSGWQGVYDLLTADGYRVSVVQNPTLSLEADATATRMILDHQDGPTILVGHSYGGAVISEAGTHERVAALVYICAFAPDAGESVNTLIAGFPASGPQPPILPPVDGFLFLDRDKFHHVGYLLPCPWWRLPRTRAVMGCRRGSGPAVSARSGPPAREVGRRASRGGWSRGG